MQPEGIEQGESTREGSGWLCEQCVMFGNYVVVCVILNSRPYNCINVYIV